MDFLLAPLLCHDIYILDAYAHNALLVPYNAVTRLHRVGSCRLDIFLARDAQPGSCNPRRRKMARTHTDPETGRDFSRGGLARTRARAQIIATKCGISMGSRWYNDISGMRDSHRKGQRCPTVGFLRTLHSFFIFVEKHDFDFQSKFFIGSRIN